MKNISSYVVGLAVFAAAVTIAFTLFPLSGQLVDEFLGVKPTPSLGSREPPPPGKLIESDLFKRLTILLVTAVIATVVVWVFKRVRGDISINASLLGDVRLECSGAQTQITMWCLVFAVINLVK
jgi:hypothetical protein